MHWVIEVEAATCSGTSGSIPGLSGRHRATLLIAAMQKLLTGAGEQGLANNINFA